MAEIIEIDQLRTNRERSERCYCDAARAGHGYFAGQLTEIRVAVRKPAVLCLETLEGGIPSVAGGWDLIYSALLFNQLPAVAARQVVKAAVERLAPGGRLLVANIRAHGAAGRCQRCKTISGNRRSEAEMVQLAGDVPLDTVSGQVIFPDPTGLNVYLELHKSTASLQRRQLITLPVRQGSRFLADSQPA